MYDGSPVMDDQLWIVLLDKVRERCKQWGCLCRFAAPKMKLGIPFTISKFMQVESMWTPKYDSEGRAEPKFHWTIMS